MTTHTPHHTRQPAVRDIVVASITVVMLVGLLAGAAWVVAQAVEVLGGFALGST